jgi:hypothetical protein
MKFLQSTKTGSVWIAQDAPAQKAIDCEEAVELTREQYADIMSRRSESYTIGQSEHVPHRVTFTTDKRSWELFLERLRKEGVDRKDCYASVARLFNEYALGANLVMRSEMPKRVKNAYMDDIHSNVVDAVMRELSEEDLKDGRNA